MDRSTTQVKLTIEEDQWVILRVALDRLANDTDAPAKVRQTAGELRDGVELQGMWDWSHAWHWRL